MRRFVALLVAAVAAALFWTQFAAAAPVTKTLNFPLSGHSTTSIYDSGPQECCAASAFGVDLGDITAELTFNLDSTLSSPTHSALTFTDTNLRQGRTLDLTNTYSRDSGGSFDAKYTLALTADVYGFNINPSVSESDTLSCAEPLESESCSHTKSIHLFSITVLDIGLGSVNVSLDVPITTNAALTSDGVTSNRTMSVAGSNILGPGNLTFTSDPFVKDESTFLSCNLPANEPVNYAMGTATSDVNGSVTENLGLSVSVVGSPIVGPDFTILGPFDIFSVALPPVTLNQINMSAPAQNVDLGTLLPNNIPPTITGTTIGGTLVEGRDVTLQAGVNSPCGTSSLHTVWKFSNPNSIEAMTAYGANADIVFPDNGIYDGTVTVTDPTGLSTTQDIGPINIANAAPSVDPVQNKSGEWGDAIKYHVDAFDAAGDQGSLAYHWSFGDGSSANGQNVEHAFSTPGTYAGTVYATDKDGGVGSATFTTTVTKRAVTLVYTGDVKALTKTFPNLAATLTDDHNAPVNGGAVTFTLGTQSVSSQVDSTGHTATTLLLNQVGDADYTLSAVYSGNALYLPSSSVLPPTFHIYKRKTNVTYLGDTNKNPNHFTTLAARVLDELGQPVVGATVKFTVGSQTATAITDSTGLATVGITLTQNPGSSYPLVASYAGDGNYLASSSGPQPFGIPNGNGAVPLSAFKVSAFNAAVQLLVAHGRASHLKALHHRSRRTR
jgi:hypothetical protein